MSYYNTEFHVYFYRLMDKLIGIQKFVISHVFQNYQLTDIIRIHLVEKKILDYRL